MDFDKATEFCKNLSFEDDKVEEARIALATLLQKNIKNPDVKKLARYIFTTEQKKTINKTLKGELSTVKAWFVYFIAIIIYLYNCI